MANPADPAKLLDIDVYELARMGPLVAADRLGRLERRQPIEAQPLQDAANARRRNSDLNGDLPAGMALPSQSFNGRADGQRCLARR